MRYSTARNAMILTLALSFIACLAYYQVVSGLFRNEERADNIKERIVELNYRLSDFVYDGKIPDFNGVIDNALASTGYFKDAYVTDFAGKILASSDRKAIGSAYDRESVPLNRLSAGNLLAMRSVFMPIAFNTGTELVAYNLVVELADRGLLAMPARRLAVLGFPPAILLALVFTIIFLFANRTIIRPVRGMYAFSERKEPMETRFLIDEMEYLRVAMMQNVSALSMYGASLQDEVASRTEELASMNRELDAIFNSVEAGIALIRDRSILRCNRRLEELFGFAGGGPDAGRTGQWRDTGDAFFTVIDDVGSSLEGSRAQYAERRLTRPDGSRFWARIYLRPTDANDPRREIIAVIDDITEERKVAEALKRAKTAAEAASRSKSTFLANMSHEIRTPMNAILGMTYLALRNDPPTRVRDYLRKIEFSGKHLLGILNSILDLSKIEAGKMTIESREFTVQRVFASVDGILRDKAADKGLELTYRQAPDIPSGLCGDELKIGQILLNYGMNAIKFTERGSVAFGASVAGVTDEDVVLRFEVTDTGIGVKKDDITRIFQTFQQADSSTTRKFGGTGLGLAISRRLALLMGGAVGAESAPGQGSTFWFTARVSRQRGGNAANKETCASNGRVYVVGENGTERAGIRDMLATMSFDAEEIPSGAACVERLAAARGPEDVPSVILLNFRTRNRDGVETARKINALKLPSAPRVILLSAFSGEIADDARAGAGIAGVLQKPVTPSQLFDALIGMANRPPDGNVPDAARRALERRLEEIAGARILLAEDNEVNQEVTVGLLAEVGILADVAATGAEAIERLESFKYPLILMDMQMPEVDGIEATRRIKKRGEWADIPIIALTANAMHQDEERCLEAGMDGYIPKPIEPDRLWATLVEWIAPTKDGPGRVGRVTAKKAASTRAQKKARILDAGSTLDTKLGLTHTDGDGALLEKIARKFAGTAEDDATRIGQAIAAGKLDEARLLVHSMKGTAGSIGATDLLTATQGLERAILGKAQKTALDDAMAALKRETTELLAAIGKAWPSATREAAAPTKRERARMAAVCAQLRALLEENDAGVPALFDENRTLLTKAFPESYRTLEKAINKYDYDAACRILEGNSRHGE